MFDENSPERRLALAPYDELIARYDATTAAIGEEFARELSSADKAAAQRDKDQSEQLAEILEKEKTEQQQPNQWTAPREKETTISFGEFDDEQKSWSVPTPPMGLPPLPPIPEPFPAPEPPRPAAQEPMMQFGVLDDDDTPPPPPPPVPRPGRRRLQDDDDDMSGQTWLS